MHAYCIHVYVDDICVGLPYTSINYIYNVHVTCTDKKMLYVRTVVLCGTAKQSYKFTSLAVCSSDEVWHNAE